MSLRRIITASALGLTLLVTACGQSTVGSAPGGDRPGEELHLSRVKNYGTVAELRAESTMVVRGTASTSREETVNDIPITFTRLRVDQHVAGYGAGAETVEIVQLGGRDVASPDSSSVLKDGSRYLLFLKPYDATSESSAPAFVITGDQGVFIESSGRYEFTGAAGAKLPKRIPAESLLAQARQR